MSAWITPESALAILQIAGLVFVAFLYFRKPQENSERRDALMSQQLKFMGDSTDRRFKDMQDSFQVLVLQSNNHIHTVDTKVEALGKLVNEMGVSLAKLSTIIDERIPKKAA